MKHTLWFMSLALFLAACGGGSSTVPSMPAGSNALRSATTNDIALPADIASGVPETPLGDVRFTVALPLRNEPQLNALLAGLSNPDSPSFRKFITEDEFVKRFAPTMQSRVAVARELKAAGFRVSVTDQAVLAGGTAAQVQRYFKTSLSRRQVGPDTVLAANGLRLTPLLARSSATVIGLAGTPLMQRFSRFSSTSTRHPENISGKFGPYYAVDLKQAYQFPSFLTVTGAGVKIGIVIDSPIHTSDISTYFSAQKLHEPRVTNKPIDGGGKFGAGTGESTLDVEQSGGMAPGAAIAVYGVPELSNEAVYDAYSAIVKGPAATIVNSSFGQCETNIPLQVLKTIDNVFEQGATEGVTWIAASDDNAAFICGSSNNAQGVAWPAVSSWVLGVGGSNLTTTYAQGNVDSAYKHEDAFADTIGGGSYWGSGGGYSKVYARPSYQSGFVQNPGRGVPDVSVHMGGLGFSSGGRQCQGQKCNVDDSSDWVRLNNKWTEEIGTSAASPDFVGLMALISQKVHSALGDPHAELYKLAKKRNYYFRSSLKGDNGFKTTSTLWDPVLGLGTPYGARLAGIAAVAGEPLSASNP
jgi:subtilase family serine protease